MMASNGIWQTAGLAIMCLLTSFGCLAHLVLFLVILSSSNLRRSNNSFIISLSLTGFLAASVVFPSAISVFHEYRSTNSSNNNNDTYPSWGTCSIFQGLHNFTIYNSAWLVSAIAIERHVSIARPFYVASKLNYLLLNVALVVASILLALIPILLSSDPICYYSLYAFHFPDLILSAIVFVLAYILPCVIIVLMYSKVYRVARNASNTIQQPHPYQLPYETSRIWTVNSFVPDSQQQTISTKQNKAIKTLILIIGTYFTLWSPYWIFYLVKNLTEESTWAIPLYVTDNGSTVVTWLMYTSISINPLLYGLLNRAVRSELLRKIQIVGRFLSRRTETRNQQQERDGYGQENFWEFLERTNSPSSIGRQNI